MKKKENVMKKKGWIICGICAAAVVIVLVLIFIVGIGKNAWESTTMGTYRDLLNTYFEENEIEITEGTAEYREYCQDQLTYEADEELKNQEQYEEILDYMSLYLAEYDELSAVSEDEEIDMSEFFKWTWDEAEQKLAS